MELRAKANFLAILTTSFLIGTYTNNIAYAKDNETIKEKAKEMTSDSARAAKKTGRKIQDKTCEMVNGKMKCVVTKMKHAAQNTADNVEDAID